MTTMQMKRHERQDAPAEETVVHQRSEEVQKQLDEIDDLMDEIDEILKEVGITATEYLSAGGERRSDLRSRRELIDECWANITGTNRMCCELVVSHDLGLCQSHINEFRRDCG